MNAPAKTETNRRVPPAPDRGTQVHDAVIPVVTLWLVTLVGGFSLVRIFTTRELAPLIASAVTIAFAAGVATRIARLNVIFEVFAATATLAVLAAVWIHHTNGERFRSSMVRVGWNAMRSSWRAIPDLKTPVDSQLGFALIVLLATWGVALIADIVAFRLRAPIEAMIPSVVVLAVAAAIARHVDRRSRVLFAATFVTCGVLHVASVSIHQRHDRHRWFSGRRPPTVLTVAVAGLVAASLGGAVLLIAPRSGLDALQPKVDFKVSSSSDGPRVVTSPLVSLKRQLLALSDAEQFSVRSVDATGQPARAYWRQTALDDFDGRTWSRRGSFNTVSTNGRLQGASQEGTIVSTEVRIGALESVWLPAAYRPASLDASHVPRDGRISFDRETGSLITARNSVEGLTYAVVSRLPSTALVAQQAVGVGVEAANALRLPDDFPSDVRQLVVDLTRDTPTPFEKARAIQDYLRTFRYSTAIPAPSSLDDLDRFLFQDRAGYCEQFSGAFAAMARAVGLPSRVAVGYTPGRYDPTDGRFHVSGRNAHAWPEVLFDGAGWVAFEPTPGRGIPGGVDYTGVPDQDLSEGRGPGAALDAGTAPTTAPSTVPAPVSDVVPTTISPANRKVPDVGRLSSAAWALGAGAVGLAFIGALVLLRRRIADQVRRARARAGGPVAVAELAWRRVLRAHRMIGNVPRPGEGVATFVERARSIDGADAPAPTGGLRTTHQSDPTTIVVEAVLKARFAPDGTLGRTQADDALEAAEAFERDVLDALPRSRRDRVKTNAG